MVDAGYEVLADRARRGDTTDGRISYRHFSDAIQDRTGLRIEAHDYPMSALLNDLARKSFAAKKVILSAILITQDTGQPGSGFFEYAKEVGLLAKKAKDLDRVAFWAQHTRLVYEAYRS